MEIVFLIGSVVMTLLFIYGLGRTLWSHRGLIRAYKTSEILVPIHSILGFFLACVFFITLCAMNNTFWCLPYLFA